MKLRIEVRLDNTGETLSISRCAISTNPVDIRFAKDAAAETVEDAVNVLIERATAPLERNELREVIR